jgi:putative two-component system response regulator
MPSPDPKVEAPLVLVVDDEDGIRQALNRFLTRLGYRVVEAADAAIALHEITAKRPNAMLCDIRMPNMTGVELVPKALAEDTDLAIIMLTAIDEPRTAIECMKLGAHDYLIKPVDLDELEISLQGALRRRQLEIDRRELEQWLAREVAVRTRELEERTGSIQEIALDALAAAKQWPRGPETIARLARELGVPSNEVEEEIARRRG